MQTQRIFARRWLVLAALSLGALAQTNAYASRQDDIFRSISEGVGGSGASKPPETGKTLTDGQNSSSGSSSLSQDPNTTPIVSIPTGPIEWQPFLPYAFAGGGIFCLAIYSGIRETRPEKEGINQSKKLLRQIGRQIGLKRAEIRQLRILMDALQQAGEPPMTQPLALLLSPSAMTRAVQQAGGRIDRTVVANMARRVMIRS